MCIRSFSRLLVYCFMLLPPVFGGPLTIDSLLRIQHPSNPLWSPDGRMVAYLCDEGGSWNLFVVNAIGGPSIQLTRFTDADTGRAFWSRDSQTPSVRSSLLLPMDRNGPGYGLPRAAALI